MESNISVTTILAPVPTPPDPHMISGNFYRHKTNGSLVFVASVDGPGNVRVDKKLGERSINDSGNTPVVGIAGSTGGWSLIGLFSRDEDYELVDVEITVKLR